MTVALLPYIDVDADGVARIAGKRIKVIHLVMDRMANGWGPEEIHAQYSHLSLSEVHAAFAYYYEHQALLDEQIRADFQQAETLRAEAGESPVVQRLRALGKLA